MPLSETRRPLEDMRIIAVEQYGAGPFGSLHLADLGAEIIKIEDPSVGGDVGRYVPPFADGGDSLFFQTFNRNKRTIDLDLTNPAGRAVFLDLVQRADAVYSNLRGDVPARLRIRYEDLKDANPRIVCCSLSGFGMTGPRRAEPAYDYILQALTGWMSLTGEPDGAPSKTGLSLVDYSGGLIAAFALVSGIHAARRDGKGMDCDLSLYDVGIGMLTYLATWHLTREFMPVRTRNSAHPSLVPFQNFQTADGWIVIGCAKEKFWQRLTDVIGMPELATDPRFIDFAERREHAGVLTPILEDRIRRQPSEHWLGLLREAGVPSAPVRGLPDALRDPHTVARDLILEYDHPTFGHVRTVPTVARVGDQGVPEGGAPVRNAHAATILQDLLEYDGERVRQLRESGAFGSASASIARE